MKRLILILLLLPVILACKKTDFKGERPDERLSKTMSEYNDLLSGAKYGWKAHLFPAKGRGFGFLFEFNGKNRVSMMADIQQESASKAMESSYRLKATALPSLYFDTYSYIHLLADPDPEVNDGTPGWGLYSDFEFSIMKVSQDTIQLKGNLSGSDLILIRASQEEQQAYKDGNLNTLRAQVADFFKDKRFSYLETQKGTQLMTAIDLDHKTLSLSFDSAGIVITKTRGFAFSGLNELALSESFAYDDLVFSKLIMDSKNNQILIPVGSRKVEIFNSSDPIFPLSKMIGTQYKEIRVPMEEEVPGSGADFNTRRNTFLASGKDLLAKGTTFPQMILTFDPDEQLLTVNQLIRQGANTFSSYFVFTYTQKDNVFKFNYEGPISSNGALLEQVFIPVLQGLASGAITLDYALSYPALSASGISSTQPAFKFIGELY